MLTELCQELRNWFDLSRHFGTFEIKDGNLTADFLAVGQYYRICGSIFNDGVHQWPTDILRDETFEGSVWALAIPEPVIKLADEIDEWREKYENADSAALSPFVSESFGGYSYTKSGSGSNADVCGASWQTAFRTRLNRWRKI